MRWGRDREWWRPKEAGKLDTQQLKKLLERKWVLKLLVTEDDRNE
jgi:hypothetical protein